MPTDLSHELHRGAHFWRVDAVYDALSKYLITSHNFTTLHTLPIIYPRAVSVLKKNRKSDSTAIPSREFLSRFIKFVVKKKEKNQSVYRNYLTLVSHKNIGFHACFSSNTRSRSRKLLFLIPPFIDIITVRSIKLN